MNATALLLWYLCKMHLLINAFTHSHTLNNEWDLKYQARLEMSSSGLVLKIQGLTCTGQLDTLNLSQIVSLPILSINRIFPLNSDLRAPEKWNCSCDESEIALTMRSEIASSQSNRWQVIIIPVCASLTSFQQQHRLLSVHFPSFLYSFLISVQVHSSENSDIAWTKQSRDWGNWTIERLREPNEPNEE